MAVKFYRLLFGMKQHPSTFRERDMRPVPPYHPTRDIDEYQMLFAGDVFAVEENLIMRPGPLGGWVEQDAKTGAYQLAIAVEVKDADKQSFTTRDEPSRVVGINISEDDFARLGQADDARAHVLAPLLPVARNAPESVKSAPRARK